MGENTLKALARENLTPEGRKKLRRELLGGMITLALLAAGLLYTYILGEPYSVVPGLFYFAGFLVEGLPVIVTGVRGVFRKNLTNAMEILVGIAIVACVFNGQLILALLIPLILNTVHILEERSILGGRDVIDGLRKMRQDTAVLMENGVETTVDARTLRVGQQIRVRPGAGIPIDGVVLSGESHIDQKSLTGEPLPAHVRKEDPVYAGTLNLEGLLLVEVRKEYVDTSFSRILGLLEKSQSITVPESRIIDRFMTYFIPFVLAVAAAVALITRNISQAIAILVVACPCGQMLAVPAPMIAALAAATRRGILIKNSKFVEDLADVHTVVFDKTGTVTRGSLSVVNVVGDSDSLLACAAALSEASGHPIARAVTAFCRDRDLPPMPAMTVREYSGKGTEGITADGCVTARFGRAEWLADCGCTDLPDVSRETDTVSLVTLNNRYLGYFCFNDTLREGAQACMEKLRQLGISETVILTGDRDLPARQIAASLGADAVYSRLLPEDKLTCLRQLSADGRKILAVGDGINDALVLREADVGIAMGAMGSDLAIDSADIALMNNRLENIPCILSLARITRNVIYQNLTLSISISVIMILLSALGLIPALLGAFLHNLGALVVLVNSARILRQDKDLP